MDHTTEHILPEHPVKNVGGHKPWPSACRVWPPEHPVKNVGGHKRRLVRAPSVWNQLATPVKNVGGHKHRLALAIAGILAIAPTAGAGLPDTEAFNGLQEVSDAELDHMRGKFIASNNQVMYFGVAMVSQWQTPAGDLVTAGANLNIDFHNGNGNTPTAHFVPTVTIVSNGAPAGPSGNTNEVSGGAGLANVSGITQSIQVAGQSNRIRNDIDMQVDLQGGGSISGAVQGQDGPMSATGSDGSIATVTLADNRIGVAIDVPGQGQVLQQIRDNGMMQTVQIGGDMNQIHNQLTMNIGLNTATGLSSAGMTAALQGLHGIRQAGMF
jgi:hypothetical protein